MDLADYCCYFLAEGGGLWCQKVLKMRHSAIFRQILATSGAKHARKQFSPYNRLAICAITLSPDHPCLDYVLATFSTHPQHMFLALDMSCPLAFSHLTSYQQFALPLFARMTRTNRDRNVQTYDMKTMSRHFTISLVRPF